MARIPVGQSWLATGYAVTPETSRQVMQVIGSLGAYSTGQRFAWRGMSSADYLFTSALERELRKRSATLTEADVRAAEQKMLTDARDWGLGGGRFGQVDDLQLLAELQHFGSPTRLVDLTSNPMTALWFACDSPRTGDVGKSGLVVALNVSDWETYPSEVTRSLVAARSESPESRLLAEALAQDKPFLVRAVEANERIAAQEGYFVASGVPASPSAASPFPAFEIRYTVRTPSLQIADLTDARGRGLPSRLPFVAIIVKAGIKRQLREYLDKTFSKSARTLFPDFPGFRAFGTDFSSNEPEDATP